MISSRQHIATIIVCLLMANCFVGCSLMPSISPYDVDTYKQAAALNTKIHNFFVKMAGSDDEHKKYKHHKATYEEILIDFMTLLTRAEIREETDTIDAIKRCIILWRQNILIHKEGGDSPTARSLAKTLRNEGVEKAYEQSKHVHTAATSEQMNARYLEHEHKFDTETILQQLRLILKSEVSRKAQ